MTLWMYEIQVLGHVPEDVLARIRAELGDVSAAEEPASTLITTAGPDQAGLLGVLDRLQGLGLNIREVRRAPVPANATRTGPVNDPPDPRQAARPR
jgi:hypothetical protein